MCFLYSLWLYATGRLLRPNGDLPPTAWALPLNPHKAMLKIAGPVVTVTFGIFRKPVTLVSDPGAVSCIIDDIAKFTKGPGYDGLIAKKMPSNVYRQMCPRNLDDFFFLA